MLSHDSDSGYQSAVYPRLSTAWARCATSSGPRPLVEHQIPSPSGRCIGQSPVEGCAQRPVKTGLRFSRNARPPSAWSALRLIASRSDRARACCSLGPNGVTVSRTKPLEHADNQRRAVGQCPRPFERRVNMFACRDHPVDHAAFASPFGTEPRAGQHELHCHLVRDPRGGTGDQAAAEPELGLGVEELRRLIGHRHVAELHRQ